MNKPAHLIGGLTTGIVASKYIVPTITTSGMLTSIELVGAVLFGAVIGSLLPDIDHRHSYIGRKLKIASFIISKTLGHRSVVHAPLIIFGITAILYFFSNQLTGTLQVITNFFVVGLSFGMWSHLLLDMMTKRGIPLLYPFTKKSFRIANFRGGGIGDKLISSGCTIIIILMFLDFFKLV